MQKTTAALISALLLVLITAACAVSGVPTTSPDTVASIVAATMAAITPPATETSVPPTVSLLTPAPSTVPPTLPPVIATVVVPGATRITFLTGATTAVVSAPIQSDKTQSYVLRALQGQPMLVNVGSLNNDVYLSIKTQGGTSMLAPSLHQTSWQGSLPQTEDYYLTVHGGQTTENFTLTVTIASRIKFAQGEDSAKLSGRTVAGYGVTYTAFATSGQKMTVQLSNLSGEAALTIYGFADGQPYVRSASEQTKFAFTLPATQDYIIEVVPMAGTEVSYLLTVKIQ